MSTTLAKFLDWTSDGFPNEDNIGLHLGNKRGMVTAAADFFLTAAAPASLPRNLVRNYSFRIRGLVSAERVGLRLSSYFPS